MTPLPPPPPALIEALRDALRDSGSFPWPPWLIVDEALQALATHHADALREWVGDNNSKIAIIEAQRDAALARESQAERGWVDATEELRKAEAQRDAALADAARLRTTSSAAINALMSVGCRVQNDRGIWRVRKPHDDMQSAVDAVNATVPLARAAIAATEQQQEETK